MKIVYICECCDCPVGEIIAKAPEIGGSGVLTPVMARDIIKDDNYNYLQSQEHNNKEERYFLPSLCEDCREALYGPQEVYYSREPRLH